MNDLVSSRAYRHGDIVLPNRFDQWFFAFTAQNRKSLTGKEFGLHYREF